MKVRKVKIGARYQLGERLGKEGEGLRGAKTQRQERIRS